MRVKKKGQVGQAKNFLTRTQAVRKLQISLPDFRRLCIFKGIYPREPRNKRKASKSSTASTTFYYTKDIQYLLHEPLLAKFRDHKALAKKIARSLGRGEVGDAARLEKRGAGKLSLDHVIKERYPTFVDALRDLDDALSLLFLFSNLPSTSTVPPKTIALCQRLCLEFQHYLITTNSLRKSFLSIKGIYYQATIQGQDILWLVPYKFVQRVTGDVDFRIMGTFVEFYTTLLGFVNFRLYTSVGLVYPPRFDSKRDEQGAELDAFTLEGREIDEPAQIDGQVDGQLENGANGTHELDEATQKKIANLPNEEEPSVKETIASKSQNDLEEEPTTETIDTFTAIAADADILPQPRASSNEIATLFSAYTFYISRECPRAPLEFLLRAFGCKRVGWDAVLGPGAFTHDETDPSITHQVVDRPPLASAATPSENRDANAEDRTTVTAVKPGHRIPGRTYVQPQWVWDSVNEVKCLRPDLYAPGATLPPHLSPWVKPSKGMYDPRVSLAEQEREGEGEEMEVVDGGIDQLEDGVAEEDEEDEVDDEEEGAGVPLKATENIDLNGGEDDEHGMAVAVAEDTDEEEEGDAADEDDDFTGFDSTSHAEREDNDDDDDDPALQHQKELEAEAAGLPLPLPTTAKKADGTPLKGILKSSSSSFSSTSQPGKSSAGDEARRKVARKARREEEEELERRKGMLGNRKRKLVEKMMFANRQKEGEAERLRGKRRRVERGSAGGGSGGKV